MRNGRSGVTITHKEYIGDISASTAFKLQLAQNINPSNYVLFPWLSTIAQNFEEYQFAGLVFEFKTMSSSSILSNTSTALGTVMMGTEYDILDGNFGTKVQMNNHQWSSSTKPSMNMLHGIETKKGQNVLGRKFCRNFTSLIDPNVSDDPRFYDIGIFQVATQGMQAAVVDSTIGELWASYSCKFYKPQLINGINTNFQQRIIRSSAAADAGTTTITTADPFRFITTDIVPNPVGLGNRFTGKNPLVHLYDDASVVSIVTFDDTAPDSFYRFDFRMWYSVADGLLGDRIDNYERMWGALQITTLVGGVVEAAGMYDTIPSGSTLVGAYNTSAPGTIFQVPANTTNIAGGKQYSSSWVVKLQRQTQNGVRPSFHVNVSTNYGPLSSFIDTNSCLMDLIITPIDSSLINSRDISTYPPL